MVRFALCGNDFEHIELKSSQVIVIELTVIGYWTVMLVKKSANLCFWVVFIQYAPVTTKSGLWSYIVGWSVISGWINTRKLLLHPNYGLKLYERWSLSSGGPWDRFYCIKKSHNELNYLGHIVLLSITAFFANLIGT